MAQSTAKKDVFYKATPYATETYLSRRELEGGVVSSPHPTPFIQRSKIFLTLLNNNPISKMAYFNGYSSLYPTSSFREEFNTYQFLDQTSATEEASYEGQYGTFTDGRCAFELPEFTVGSSTSLPATAGHGKNHCNLSVDWCLMLESLEPLAPTTTNIDGYNQPSYSDDYWPEVGRQAPSHYSGSSSQDLSSAGTAVLEPSAAVPTLSSGKCLFS